MRLIAALASLALAACAAGCASGREDGRERIRVGGSDTMVPLVRAWAERFMQVDPAVVEVAGGGSGTGPDLLARREIDVAASSRPLSAEEVERLFRRTGRLGVRFLVARDAVSVFVNAANPVRDVTRLQLKGIFTGRIGTWHKLGGADTPIQSVVRQPNSGTYRFFQDVVLDGEPFSERARTEPTTPAVVAAVEADPDAVGYGGLPYGSSVVMLRVDGIWPSAENVRNGTYPLSRYLLLVTVEPPRGAAKRFIDWVLGDDGQRTVTEIGFVSLFD